MKRAVNIGIIGDYDAKCSSHLATNEAINHASIYLKIEPDVTWLPTPSFLEADGYVLSHFDGIWVSPGSPYVSMEGALKGIQLSREMNKPLIGT